MLDASLADELWLSSSTCTNLFHGGGRAGQEFPHVHFKVCCTVCSLKSCPHAMYDLPPSCPHVG